MKKILVTGGAGYIGSHTIVELLELGYDVISVDNYLNSSSTTYERIQSITGRAVEFYDIDLSNEADTLDFFKDLRVDAVIHFAALKSVPESVDVPLSYYKNNLNSLLHVIEGMKENKIKHLIFSSSCSVYGNPEKLPVTEDTPFGEAESPYARSKQMGEHILKDYCKSAPDFKALSLRYFNPAGAHSSIKIGEAQSERPNNLVPIITQTAAGIRKEMTVFGTDYATRDGSCIRDYIHVSDIAIAHVKGLEYLLNIKKEENYQVINLGSGIGTTVLEMLHSFEKVSGQKLNYNLGERRAGDVSSIYANNNKAKSLLNWEGKRSLDDILASAWEWQKKLL